MLSALYIICNFITTNTWRCVFHNSMFSWDNWGSDWGSFPKLTWQLRESQDIKFCLISESKELITMLCCLAMFSGTRLQLMLANHLMSSDLSILTCKMRMVVPALIGLSHLLGLLWDPIRWCTCSIVIMIIAYIIKQNYKYGYKIEYRSTYTPPVPVVTYF